jgi:hypothetical protein
MTQLPLWVSHYLKHMPSFFNFFLWYLAQSTCQASCENFTNHIKHFEKFLSGLWDQGGRDRKGACAAVQHRGVVGPNEATHQGRRCHVATACDCVGLYLGGGRAPWHGVVQVRNERGCQAVLRGCKGLARTKLGLDGDFMPAQQVHKSELWLLFKEAKVANKCIFWRTTKLFVDGT